MTTPRVTELPQQMEAVHPDPFIEAQAPIAPAGPRAAEREQKVRRLDLVRRAMRVHGAGRNGSSGQGTERA